MEIFVHFTAAVRGTCALKLTVNRKITSQNGHRPQAKMFYLLHISLSGRWLNKRKHMCFTAIWLSQSTMFKKLQSLIYFWFHSFKSITSLIHIQWTLCTIKYMFGMWWVAKLMVFIINWRHFYPKQKYDDITEL